MNDQVRTALRNSIAEEGASLLSSGESLRNSLAESFPDSAREIDALAVAADAHVPSELRDYSTPAEARVALDASILRLERGFRMDRPAAAWAVLTFSSVLGHLPDEQFHGLLSDLGGEASVPSGSRRAAPTPRPQTPAAAYSAAPPPSQPPPPPPLTRRMPPPPRAAISGALPTNRRKPNMLGIVIAIAGAIFVIKMITQSTGQVSTAPDSPSRETPSSQPAPPPPAEPQPVGSQSAGSQSAGQSPLKVDGRVQQEKLLVQTNPDYPSLAKTSRVEGVVTLKAVIAADGTVKELEPVSGHPLLLPAAIQAVKQWRYRPTMVNGAPVEVVTQVDVQFTLQP